MRTRGFEVDPAFYAYARRPQRQTTGAAGYDIHAVVKDREPGWVDMIEVQPGTMKVIETGLWVYMQEDEELQLRPRSGLSFKHQVTIQNSPATIDSDYYQTKNTIKVMIRNEGQDTFYIKNGDRIAQGVFAKILFADDDYPADQERESGFGHTGV